MLLWVLTRLCQGNQLAGIQGEPAIREDSPMHLDYVYGKWPHIPAPSVSLLVRLSKPKWHLGRWKQRRKALRFALAL